MKNEDILTFCGYTSAYSMISDNSTNEELLEILEQLIGEDETGLVREILEEIAYEKYEWRDEEAIKEYADDMAYEAYREKMYFGED